MKTSHHAQATLDQISTDIRRALTPSLPLAEKPLTDQLWELSESRKVQLEDAVYFEAAGNHAGAELAMARAAAIKEQAMALIDAAREVTV